MSGPVVTVGEDADVREIARLLAAYRIKRVPVVRDGRIVGIVSRADLLRVLAAEQPEPVPVRRGGLLAGALAGLDERFAHWRRPDQPGSARPRREPDDAELMAANFRSLDRKSVV